MQRCYVAPLRRPVHHVFRQTVGPVGHSDVEAAIDEHLSVRAIRCRQKAASSGAPACSIPRRQVHRVQQAIPSPEAPQILGK